MADDSRSMWTWLGCGCAVLVAIAILLIAVVAFFGVQTARTLSDPESRRDLALEYLNAAVLPDGYETEIAMKVPFVAEVVVLQHEDAQFVYLGHLRTDADLGAAFDDDEAFDRELRRAGLNLRRGQAPLAREAFRVGPAELRYVLLEGDVDFDATGNTHFDFDFGEVAAEEDEIKAQISAVVLVRCSAGREPGLGLWAGPRVTTPSDASEPADTTADQAALREWLEQFGFCTR